MGRDETQSYPSESLSPTIKVAVTGLGEIVVIE
jgi:hypothetical protein